MVIQRNRRRLALVALVCFIALTGGYVARDALIGLFASTFIYDSSADWEFAKTRQQLGKGHLEETDARDKLIEIARQNPGSQAKFRSLTFVASKWPKSSEATSAIAELPETIDEMSVDDLASCFDTIPVRSGSKWHPVASALLARTEREPEHPRAAKLLAMAAIALRPSAREQDPSDELLRIANLVQERYANSPDLVNYCEAVGNLGDPEGWMHHFEPHMRHILEVNQDRFVRCSAHYALATIVRSGGIKRQGDAMRVYEEFLANFDGNTPYLGQPVEQDYRQGAERALKIMRSHGLGMIAPETRGFDLDGADISLSEYRGRVVLVSFWATWCGPCLQAIPHEREMLSRFDSSNFAIVGMNADDDIQDAIDAVKQHRITWRSLHVTDHRFVNNWTVPGYPTFVLLDKEGRIMGLWTGLPSDSKLYGAISDLIEQ